MGTRCGAWDSSTLGGEKFVAPARADGPPIPRRRRLPRVHPRGQVPRTFPMFPMRRPTQFQADARSGVPDIPGLKAPIGVPEGSKRPRKHITPAAQTAGATCSAMRKVALRSDQLCAPASPEADALSS